MKISQVLAFVDKMKPGNPYDKETKLRWLNELEGDIQSRLFHTAPQEIIQYTTADMDTELLVPVPHDKIYWMWVAAMIDFANGEYDRYQNTMQLVNDAWDTYAKWFHRKFHEDVGGFLYIGGTTKYGLSAYQIAVNHGFQGDEAAWLLSLKGLEGPAGKAGPAVEGIDYDSLTGLWNFTFQNGDVIGVAGPVLSDVVTDESVFVLDADGVIALTEEYRGACPSEDRGAEFPLSVSDRGIGKEGSLYHALPKHIVIPETVGGKPVKALAPGMFYCNKQVVSIRLPEAVRVIPERFADNAFGLREITGTAQVEHIRRVAFQTCGLRNASFPALETVGQSAFSQAFFLTCIDIGDKVTALPNKAFFYNENLASVKGGASVTAVGDQCFAYTERLKMLPFTANLKSIGANAFRRSRLDYDWNSLSDCTFGTTATSLQINPVDFWTQNTAYATACEVPLKSCFHQQDPAWKNLPICGDNGPVYGEGCWLFSCLAAYSALSGETVESPVKYVENLGKIDPALVQEYTYTDVTQRAWLAALGYTLGPAKIYSASTLKELYLALAAGKVAITNCIKLSDSDADGHAMLIHGINEQGELLVVDSDSGKYKLGVYGGESYAIPVQNLVRPAGSVKPNRFYIVEKA